ncbi:MAG: 3-keto-acyl-acp dehydratase [Trebouxia sp. A1-2]|nr:MAG: 3-keto-acyl-acp dehydratase [Trebouxia sp. A1-2]
MAQLGGLLMINPENEAAKNNFFFGGVDNCKWRRPVVPGDCLSHGFTDIFCCATQMMRVELVKFNKRYGFAKMRGTCHVGANLVCEADLNLVMGK